MLLFYMRAQGDSRLLELVSVDGADEALVVDVLEHAFVLLAQLREGIDDQTGDDGLQDQVDEDHIRHIVHGAECTGQQRALHKRQRQDGTDVAVVIPVRHAAQAVV